MDIKALIFDFGGTLDLDGLHWFKLWQQAYLSANVQVDDKIFEQAYFYAEETLNQQDALNLNYLDLILLKVELQFQYIYNYSDKTEFIKKYFEQASLIAKYCYGAILLNLEKTLSVINELKFRYRFAVVSNFYGNLSIVLEELKLKDFFEIIIDSKNENIRKPDSAIFLLASQRMSLQPEKCVVVGDSYVQDIIPAKNAGFNTILLINKQDTSVNYEKADKIIHSINDLINLFK